MTLDSLVKTALQSGASDIHLEPGVPVTLRVRGALRRSGEPLAAASLTELAREVLGDGWGDFVARGSADLARTVQGVRCRLNVLRSSRGVGFSIRCLKSSQVSLERLNLHPDLRKLIQPRHGLVLMCGPTGSGKSTTLAALVQEINATEARHIITVESPVEYALAPRMSLIRQREVGRDTPSFEQALLDALREDPDVLVVGEMREPEVMRLTLNAAETGHLVFATAHSATAAECLQRIASTFAPEVQAGVCAQLADCLVAVVAQRLDYREDLGIRVPACELVMASTAVKALVRQAQFFKLDSVVETGAADGSWSWARYADWLARKGSWHVPRAGEELERGEDAPADLPALPRPAAKRSPAKARHRVEEGVLVIDGSDDPADILKELADDEG